MIAAALALALVAAPEAGRTYDWMQVEHMNELGAVLRTQVAHVIIDIQQPANDPMIPQPRDGFGIAIEPDLVAIQAFLVEDARRIRVEGPNGQTVLAKRVLYDVERRVALLRTARPVASVGLRVVLMSPKDARARDMVLYALASTEGVASVIHGWMIDDGSAPGFDGHPQVSFHLSHGMPVFDAQARLVGYTRTVAWDKQGQLLVPPEVITAARTATGTATQKPKGR